MEKDYKKKMVELTNALDDFCYGLRELGFGEVTVPQDIIDLMASAYRAAKSDEFISKENYLSMINKVQELEKAEEKIDRAITIIIEFNKRIREAYRVANNILWFDDSSDYCSALWDILHILNPDLPDDNYEIELKYIEEDGKE